MTKDEYLKLYQEWTNTNDRAHSDELAEAIAKGAMEELIRLEEIYDKLCMCWKSPLHEQCDCLYDLDGIDQYHLERLNTCEVKLAMHDSRYCNKWHNVILNVKWFGDEARNALVHKLIEDAIKECNDEISEQKDQIEHANEAIADAEKKKARYEEVLKEINENDVGESK